MDKEWVLVRRMRPALSGLVLVAVESVIACFLDTRHTEDASITLFSLRFDFNTCRGD